MLDTVYQQYIHLSRYARWIEEENRRETWHETVSRFSGFFQEKFPSLNVISEIHDAVYNLEVMPSMRALMTAGPAASRDEVAMYNCSYIAINNVRAFDEIVFLLMNGTGVGFSVERQEISKLPEVTDELYESETTIVVPDSKIGWAKAYKQLISLLYSGEVPKWDLSQLRPAGARLKTFGGRSSGPAPLEDLFKFTVATFKGAKGRKLNSLEVHDIICKIGEIVVVGGVRRSALISLSNLSDQRMRDAKAGEWWKQNPQRALANNSAAYTEKPSVGQWMQEWLSLYESKSGERGVFNRNAAYKKFDEIGRKYKDEKGNDYNIGLNPCAEVFLRSSEFCNLSEIVCRKDDTYETLKEKVRIATIIGTLQSSFTNFRYLRPIWGKNCNEERLLGVSMTGVMDCPLLNSVNRETENLLSEFRKYAREVNREYAALLNIEESAAITLNKPSGTVSNLVNAGSGIHTRFAKNYIRRIRSDIKDPLTKFMIDSGFPHEQDVMNSQNIVFEFPVKAPENSITRENQTAIESLEIWKMFKMHWCDHNPSVTINVREQEWPEVGAWVWKNFDDIGGVSFLPYSDHTYRQAPYEEISEKQFLELESKMPINIDWTNCKEEDDSTISSQSLACVSGVCEL